MKITNKFNLSQIIVDSIMYYREKRDESVEGCNADYSVTQLLNPPTITALRKKHWQHLEIDVSDQLHLLQGLIIHQILEIAKERSFASSDCIIEQRRTMKINDLFGNPVIVSGCPDLFDIKTGTLYDYKYVGAYSAARDDNKDNYYKQANAYRIMLQQGGYAVNSMKIVLFIKDWSRITASSNENYPQKPIIELDVPFLEDKEILSEMAVAIDNIRNYTGSVIVPPCDVADRFQDPPEYAIMKPGAKRATKVFKGENAEAEAKLFLRQSPFAGEIEVREKQPKRCLFYCDVNMFCSYYQDYMSGDMSSQNYIPADEIPF